MSKAAYILFSQVISRVSPDTLRHSRCHLHPYGQEGFDGRRAVMADLKALVLGRAGVFQASTCASISKAVVFCHKLRFASPQMEEVRECPFFSNVLRALRRSSVQLWCDFRPMTFPVAIHRKPGAQAGHFLIVRKHGWKGTLLLCSPHMVNPQIHANSNNRDNVSRLVT